MRTFMHDFVVRKLRTVPKTYPSQAAYWRAIAAATGISVRTIEKVARLEIEDPKVKGIEVLAEHLGYTPRKAAALARGRPLAAEAAA